MTSNASYGGGGVVMEGRRQGDEVRKYKERRGGGGGGWKLKEGERRTWKKWGSTRRENVI